MSFERSDFFTILLIILFGMSAFGLGRLSVDPAIDSGISVNLMDQQATAGASKSPLEEKNNPANTTTTGTYVGSRNGSKYHLPWCSGAQRIKEDNKVWFATKEEAARFGYTPAKNCKGI